MYKAVGWHSQNEYMAGNSRADVMRKLQKEYPAPRRTSRSSSFLYIYSEPLRIISVASEIEN
ncbi:hypothetical protein [Leuconostoc pseudomesenteroides]|uniref:hypothetical protein n=1 Tax=Leuconostoc pseudomesenteroides TaxID=33968 RepID=UPI0021A4E8B6|nr:hypothetical protein [Leuconostoc pseudomesenteroides]MCT4380761.1 hypothetical protein [Leuconostoc pseudomesenteroides]